MSQANLHHLLVGRHVAAGRGDAPAAVDDGGTWSYRDLDDAAARVAGALATHGVARGARVVIALPDGRDWCAAFLGTVRLGAVAAPIEPGGRHREAILADVAPAAVLHPGDLAVAGGLAIGDALRGRAHPVADVAPGDLAYMIFSSGSTGRPKGAMHAHRDPVVSIDGYARDVLGLGPGDRTLSVARLFASLGFGNGFFRPLGRGAACVFSATRPTVRSILTAVHRHGVTVLSAVPTFWSQLATFLERHPDPAALGPVRLAVSSGDALPGSVGQRLRAGTGVDLIEGLGCSECSNIVISTRPGEPMPGALGRAVPGAEIRLADENGTPVAQGTPGRLWIRSASNTTGYWGRADETADVVHGEWIRMGDVLREDGGVYRHLGRSDDLFKVDARWVSPVEVEAVLHEHPDVVDAAVVGRPGADGLVRCAAFVVASATGDALASELRRHVAHRLGPHAAPATITFVEELPRGATGKVDRRVLRDA